MVEKGLYGLASLTLLWAAYSDVRSRRVPLPAGWGMLAIGLVVLLLQGEWLQALFCLSILLGSNFRGAIPLLGMAGIGILTLANQPASLPLVVGMGYALFAFRLGWLGGGDAQLALGLIAIGQDWQMLLSLFGVYTVLGLLVILFQRGVGGTVRRLSWVAAHWDAAETDPAAIRIPWAVVAAVGGWAYLWLLPGRIWR